MEQMLILSSYVVDSAKANVGFNYKFLKLAADSCENVTFITSNYPEEILEDLCGVTVENLPLRWSGISQKKDLPQFVKMQFKAIGAIRRHYKKGAPVVFWLSGPMLFPFLYCKLTRKKTVVFLYGNTKYKDEKPSLYNSLIGGIMRFMAKRASQIGVEAPSVLKQWNLPERSMKKVFALHLYVDREQFKNVVPVENREKVVGMSCRLQHNKHPLEAIEAFHRLRETFPEWKMEIAGNGPDYELCCQKIKELGEEESIRMLGWVDNREIGACYNRWKLLLFPSNYEGLPNSVIESMCCGTPVLASPVGGIPDVIQDGQTGWFLKEPSTEGIERQLRTILEEDRLKEVSAAAQAYALRAFSYEEVLEDFRKAFIKPGE